MKSTFLAILMVFLTFSALGEQYESHKIAKIDIVLGNTHDSVNFNPATIRNKLHSKVGDFFSQTEFDSDLKLLANEYDLVEPTIKIFNNELHITLKVWLKPKIKSVEFCGNRYIRTQQLSKTLKIAAGSTFEREDFVKAFNSLKLMYFKKGFFEAELDYEIIPVENGKFVDIKILIKEGRAGKINKIKFVGLLRCEELEILDSMVSKRYYTFLSWYNGSGIYHPEMVEHDRSQIINYLQDKGYADAMVEICVEPVRHENKINIVVKVEKGSCYHIGNIHLTGNTVFSSQEIYNHFTFGTKSVYSPEKIRSTIKAISSLYGKSGYIDVSTDVKLVLHEDGKTYDVLFKIDEAEQFHVGLVKVFGNCRTQTKMILHESLLCPGEIFNQKKLEGTERRLENTGFFKSVNVYAVNSKIEDASTTCLYRDIYIEVEETDTGNLNLFGGCSSLDQIFGGIELTERNFNLAGLTQVANKGPSALRGGAEFANAKVNIGSKQTTYLMQWTKPYFLDTPWILGVDLEKCDNRAMSTEYVIKTYGGDVHCTYIINDFLKYDAYYRARHSNTGVSDSDNPLIVKEGNQSGFISAVGNALIYDSTDNPRRASSGFRSKLGYELAGVGGNYQFMKFSYLNTYYYPFSAKNTLKLRGDLQFIKTYGSTSPTDLPLSERFFLGGETTVRGYKPFIIGPKFGNNEPRGGVSSLLLSEEIQHNICKSPYIDFFVFVDAGYVSLSEFTIGKWAASTGLGARLEVMRNVPIMLGYGWPIHPVEKINGQKINNAKRFFFALGGSF